MKADDARRERVDEAAESIHKAALDLLNDPGIQIDHDEIRALLLSNGATPGSKSDVVRIPPEMVADALAKAPHTVILTNRSGDPTELSAEGESTIWSTPGMYWNHRGEHRTFTSKDMAAFARLLDQLDAVDVVFGVAMDDVPPPARDVVGLKTIACNSSKHIRALCFSPEGAETMAEMRSVIGDHPWFSVGFTAHGPLRWTQLALEIFKRTAGKGIPTTINGEPMAGVSGPMTLAGSAAVGNAEILSGLVINQLLEPGRPCIYNLGLAHVMDMRTAIAVTGGPENALFAQISALMGRYYNLPTGSWVSTESMCCDGQAAMEKMFGFGMHMQERVSGIWSVGQLESELTLSPAMAIIDNEMIQYARRYLRGVETNEQTLAVDVTREVGIGGSFLDHEHTLMNFRTELFAPELLFRQPRELWLESGAKDLTERAEDRADQLMAEEVKLSMSDDQIRELNRIAAQFVDHIQAAV
jgi:trimethylamine:corrinoid methyltransferase-like protein